MSSTIFPTMRYQEPKKSVEFLCKAFGFEKHQVYEDEKGQVMHAELKHGEPRSHNDSKTIKSTYQKIILMKNFVSIALD